jgi:diphthamide synthase (EF-2-diphthine--ammonia ligase)
MKKKKFSEESALKIYRQANQKDLEVWQEARKKKMRKARSKKIAQRLGLEMKSPMWNIREIFKSHFLLYSR